MDNKRLAAVAGVLAYLRAAGPAPETGLSAGNTGFHAGDTGLYPSLWALYGRQAQMSQRIRLQARRRA